MMEGTTYLLVYIGCLFCIVKLNAAEMFGKQSGYTIDEYLEELDLTESSSQCVGDYSCMNTCLKRDGCKACSWNAVLMLCRLHSSSPYEWDFNGTVTANIDWNLYSQTTQTKWRPVAKFSSNTGTFEGNYSYELWNNPANSVNDDPCLYSDLSTACNRHFVHKAKDWFLGLDSVTKIKVSLYEGGNEAAWVVFQKEHGQNDNWFQPSRVLDSSPWNADDLRQKAGMAIEPQQYNEALRFHIRKSNPNLYLRLSSGHAYWLRIFESESPSHSLKCVTGEVSTPHILYGKGPDATLLTKSAVARIVGWASQDTDTRYRLSWAAAQTYCDDNLNVPIASYSLVDSTRTSQPYQCCKRGWMAGQVNSYPLTEYLGPGCGHAGMASSGSSGSWDVYCQTDQSLVGLADTMVISVNV